MPFPTPAPCESQACLPPPAVLAFALTASGLQRALPAPCEGIHGDTRGPARNAFRRQVAIYLAHVDLGLPYKVLAALFGRDRTTVAYACSVIEDRRDRPAFDAAAAVIAHSIFRLGRSVFKDLEVAVVPAASDTSGVLA